MHQDPEGDLPFQATYLLSNASQPGCISHQPVTRSDVSHKWIHEHNEMESF